MTIMKKSLREYLDEYRADHTQAGTRLTHLVGIPMVLASIPTVFLNPPVGAALFGVGWALQFVGHYVFEKNNPAFFGDPFFLLIGAIWVVYELLEMIGVHLPMPGAAASANGVGASDASHASTVAA